MSFDYKKGVWLLNCDSPAFVWGACPKPMLSSHGSGGSLHPAVRGSELPPAGRLRESTRFFGGILWESTWRRCAGDPEWSCFMKPEYA